MKLTDTPLAGGRPQAAPEAQGADTATRAYRDTRGADTAARTDQDTQGAPDGTARAGEAERREPIGAILVGAGRLSAQDNVLVLKRSRDDNVPFGQAALKMGLLRPADIRYALARQFAFPFLAPGDAALAPELVAAFASNHPTVDQMRHLRSQLMVRGLGTTPALRALAIVSAERGAGRTYVAANLAVVFAQLGQRTLLIDAHLQRPRQHRLFRSSNRIGLSTVLAGRAGVEAIRVVTSLPELALLGSGPVPPNPQDLLARQALPQLLQRARSHFDVVILDAPPWDEGSGARMAAAAAGNAILLARRHRSPADAAARVVREFAETGIRPFGVVLNRH